MDGTSARTMLGLAPTASEAEIKRAYRALAKSAHPDRGGDPATFDRLTRAYECALDDARHRPPVVPTPFRNAFVRVGRGLDDTSTRLAPEPRSRWTRRAASSAAPRPAPSSMSFAEHLRRAGA